VREFHPRLAGAAAGSPELARFPLTVAQLVIARQYGFASWARLREHARVVIRPVTSRRELARAFELIGARRAPTLEQDRYFLQLARRFGEDRTLMLGSVAGDRSRQRHPSRTRHVEDHATLAERGAARSLRMPRRPAQAMPGPTGLPRAAIPRAAPHNGECACSSRHPKMT